MIFTVYHMTVCIYSIYGTCAMFFFFDPQGRVRKMSTSKSGNRMNEPRVLKKVHRSQRRPICKRERREGRLEAGAAAAWDFYWGNCRAQGGKSPKTLRRNRPRCYYLTIQQWVDDQPGFKYQGVDCGEWATAVWVRQAPARPLPREGKLRCTGRQRITLGNKQKNQRTKKSTPAKHKP